MYNEEMLKWTADAFTPTSIEQERDEVIKSSFTSDPWDISNGGGDEMALMAQLVFWWLFLFLAVDVEGWKHGCCCYKLLYDKLRKCCSCCNDDKPRSGEIVPETKFVQGKGKGANAISSRKVEEPPMPSIKAENVAISEPHVNSCLCIVCRRGNTLTEARSLEIDSGELKVIYGPSGSGKT